ncbi:Sphingomyelin phosphodiesterase 2, neutral membrane (Neutral sphingomyelinase), partial [Coelomomyces lativittatus]
MEHLSQSKNNELLQPSQQSPPTLNTIPFKVLTYNLFLRPPPISQSQGDFKWERLALFIDTVLPNFDLICLQESFTSFSSRVNTLFTHARDLGFQTCCLGPQSCWYKFQLVDSGLVILSKWAMVMTTNCVFNSGVASDRLSAKGVLYTKLKHPTENSYLHVFNTHFQASYSLYPSESDNTVQCRMDQLKTLVNFIHTTISKETCMHPILVLGDFNMDKTDPHPYEYQRLVKALELGDMKLNVMDVLASTESSCTHRSWHDPEDSSHLDYIFLLLPPNNVSTTMCQLMEARVESFEVQERKFPRLS